MPGKLIIFSAPSGSGKTTIVTELMKQVSNLGFSVSATTRPPRVEKEVDGKDYYFLSIEDFQSKINSNEFVEWEEVYKGVFYGTLREEVERIWAQGKDVLFDVDVKGGLKLKEYFKEKALAVFIKVPSIDSIKERLIDRGTETEESIFKRIDKITFELSFENQFDVTVYNEELDKAVADSCELVNNFLES